MTGAPLPRFRCVMLRRSGASEIRIVRAADADAARAELAAAGLVPVSVEPVGPSLIDTLRERFPSLRWRLPRWRLPTWRPTRPEWLRPPRRVLVATGLILATIPVSTALGAWGLTAITRWQAARLAEREAQALARYDRIATIERARPHAEAVMLPPALSAMVTRLAVVLPQDAGLASLGLDEAGQLDIEIETPDPDRLRTALGSDPAFSKLEEVGQTNTDGGTMRVILKGRLR